MAFAPWSSILLVVGEKETTQGSKATNKKMGTSQVQVVFGETCGG